MKKKIIMILTLCLLLSISGCGKGQDTKGAPEKKQAETVADQENRKEDADPENETVPEEDALEEDALQEDAPAQSVTVADPGESYLDKERPENRQTITLAKILEEENEIIDEEAWFAEYDLEKPDFPYTDANYRYEAYGENAYDVYGLRLYDADSGRLLYDLDFSLYTYGEQASQEDLPFVFQRILYAKAEDGILYVATAHNTYAASESHTAYITAVDLNDLHVIWKSAPLTCNARSFVLTDDAVICGYGFTEEDDFLHILDQKTGRLWESIPIRTKAEYIIQRGDVLYVRTYNTNVTFEIRRL